MKESLHPAWFAEATVVCACGNTWVTGATVAQIRTDICSNCHPFYTGEQRIVDTEGQVDRFIKRLQVRDQKRQEIVEREAARRPDNLPLAELEIGKRHVTLFADAGITTVGEFLSRLQAGGDDAILAIAGVGQKMLADLKRALRNRGYDLPASENTEAAE
jgi:large subunit ribosomal protein L31